MAQGGAERSRRTRLVDGLAVAVAALGLVVLALRLWRDINAPAVGIVVALMLAAGYVMADLLTGFVHWFCDTFFEETTPIIGPGLIAPFREHHRDPLLMTRHGFLELTGSSFRGLAPVLWAFLWVGEAMPPAVGAFVFALATGAVATNLLHRWAHDPDPPAAARLLQAVGLVLTPERHARHHTPPYAAGYCVTSGWLNPVCDRMKVWMWAESALAAFGLPRKITNNQ